MDRCARRLDGRAAQVRATVQRREVRSKSTEGHCQTRGGSPRIKSPMEHEGPQLEQLTHRLSETPAEFLLPPAHRGEGDIDVAALVADHFRAMNITPPEDRDLTARIASPGITFPRRLQLIAIATWLL